MSAQDRCPLVSVLIPCFNAGPWVGEAVESALAQTWPSLEVIALDDGSTDDSLAVLCSFEGRIRVLAGAHEGLACGRNRLLAASAGEWVQLLDADDVLDPDKIAHQMDLALSAGGDVVSAPIRQAGVVIQRWTSADPWLNLMGGSLGCSVSNLYRRSVLEAVGGWRDPLGTHEDYVLLLHLLSRGARLVGDDRPLCEARCVNSESIHRGDHCRTLLNDARFVRGVVRVLERRGEDTAARRDSAVERVLLNAWRLWRLGHRGAARRAGRIAEDLLASVGRRRTGAGKLYDLVFALGGWGSARHYRDLVELSPRRWFAGRRARAGGP